MTYGYSYLIPFLYTDYSVSSQIPYFEIAKTSGFSRHSSLGGMRRRRAACRNEQISVLCLIVFCSFFSNAILLAEPIHCLHRFRTNAAVSHRIFLLEKLPSRVSKPLH